MIQEDPIEAEISCFSYGCHVLPEDLIEESVQVKLGYGGPEDVKAEEVEDEEDGLIVHGATLTLTGYKGGALQDQINQDRSLMVVPFHPFDGPDSDHEMNTSKQNTIVSKSNDIFQNMLMGVFDGHGKGGEIVSQFVIEDLPKRISNSLKSMPADDIDDDIIMNIFNETFVGLDKDAPVGDSGGCTASVVLKLQSKLYIANSGDSRTFVAIFDPITNSSEIVYLTREDKPDLPEEKERVEKMGGSVYIPPPEKPHSSSRVIYTDYKTGYRNGLAMSRSIGDRSFGRIGVIPDPLVHVIDMNSLVQKECSAIDNDENVCSESLPNMYIVSGTDGLFDELQLEEITNNIGPSLFLNDGKKLMNMVGDLVVIAAQRWGARYRDDIAMAVAKIA